MTQFINLIKIFKNYLVFSFLAVIFLASSWSLLQPGFFRAHDYVHASRIAEMSLALTEGHFPVRWSQNFGYGFGMPLFEFYAPLPFYVGSAFHLLGADLVFATKLLFLIANLGSLLGAYFLGRELFGYRGGVLLTAAFTLAPYRAVNLFIRGALSEAWGMMALPWILLGTIQTIQHRSKKGFLILTLGLVTLMLSHNLTTMMFLPMSVIYALGYTLIFTQKPAEILKTWLRLALSYGLAIGLAGFYLIPAFTEKKFTQIDTILGGYFHYSNHFLYIRQFLVPNWGYGGSGWGPNDEISFFLGLGQLLTLLLAGLIGLFYLKGAIKQPSRAKKQSVLHLLLLGGLLALGLFMTLLKSQWAWDHLPLLNYIQFPWRFLATAILFLAVISALVLKMINSALLRSLYFVIVFLLITVGNFYYFRPEKMMDNPTDLYYGDPDKIRTAQSGVLKDYVPIQMSYEGDKLKDQFERFVFPAGVTQELNQTHQKLYRFNLAQGQAVEFPIANFPNWQVELDGQPHSSFTSPTGLLASEIPSGNHTVGLIFANSPTRNLADGLSLISLLLLLAYLYHSVKSER